MGTLRLSKIETIEIYDMTLKTPFNMIISGSSGSTKTMTICKILIYKAFCSRIWHQKSFYNKWQNKYDDMKQSRLVTKFIKAIPPQ